MAKKSVLRFPWSGFSVRCLSVRNPGFWLSRFCPDFSKKILSDVFLSRFCLSRFCPVSGFCPDFQKKNFPVPVCPDSVCLDSVRCPDFVRISRKNTVRCLSVRPGKDKTELSGLSLSLSADVCTGGSTFGPVKYVKEVIHVKHIGGWQIRVSFPSSIDFPLVNFQYFLPYNL